MKEPLNPSGKIAKSNGDTMKYVAFVVVGIMTMSYSVFEIYLAMQQGNFSTKTQLTVRVLSSAL
ncbi:hypothetical protein M1146_07385 [Patescibacteria group bacterium]|nr:hypothetical protein [Patescibacteria group bacterium]